MVPRYINAEIGKCFNVFLHLDFYSVNYKTSSLFPKFLCMNAKVLNGARVHIERDFPMPDIQMQCID